MRAILLFKRLGYQTVFNEVFATPWCHVVVHFEMKMSRS